MKFRMKSKNLTGTILVFTMIAALTGCGSKTAESSVSAASAGSGSSEAAATAPVTSEAAAVSEASSAAGEWYADVLKDDAVRAEFPYYQLLDINGDGTDELFLSSTEKAFVGADQKAQLMTFYGGTPVILQEIGGAGGESWYYHAADNILVYYSRLSGEAHLMLYTLSDGSLKETAKADIYEPNHGPEGTAGPETVYLLDENEVSKEQADQFWAEYKADQDAVQFTQS